MLLKFIKLVQQIYVYILFIYIKSIIRKTNIQSNQNIMNKLESDFINK